jgi:hypothetical protein
MLGTCVCGKEMIVIVSEDPEFLRVRMKLKCPDFGAPDGKEHSVTYEFPEYPPCVVVDLDGI